MNSFKVDIPDLVVFDLAGTTVEDRGQVSEAFAAALADYGIRVTEEQIRKVRGASKRQALLKFIPEGSEQAHIAEGVYAAFVIHLGKRYESEGVEEVAGASHVFRTLREHGIRVVLNTGFDREITGILIAALGWDSGTVDGVVCGDDVAQGRPAPDLLFHAMQIVGVSDVGRVANVGDTALDLQAGFNAGVHWNIGVLSGAHGREILEREPYTHLFASVADVPGLWGLG